MDGEISPDELASLLDDDGDSDGDGGGSDDAPGGDADAAGAADLRIVDIRNPGPFERGHIPGSENIPAPELTDRIEELDGAGRVVTVCPHGKASVQAARLVSSYQGVDGPAESLRGGLEAWDGPLEAEGHGSRADGADRSATDGDESTAPF